MPAEPSQAELDDAASAGTTRADAEQFAILLVHALHDQTDDGLHDGARRFLADQLPADTRSYLDGLGAWKDTRVVPGSRSWLRSEEVATAQDAPVVTWEAALDSGRGWRRFRVG